MDILIAGARGYIGSQLAHKLKQENHRVFALSRDEGYDLLDPSTLTSLPQKFDVAFYLVHSMKDSSKSFMALEEKCAKNFLAAMQERSVGQIIYLGGLHRDLASNHMRSRKKVEDIFRHGSIPATILRVAVVVGEGSASFEMIRDLVEKLPMMVAPKWVKNRCQPIAIADLLFYLVHVMNKPECLNQVFELGGPDYMTYRGMLLSYAKVRGLKRWIINVPVLTPRLSSYWLYFIASTSFSLARALVESLKSESISHENKLATLIPHQCMTYEEAVKEALKPIPKKGIFLEYVKASVRDREQALNRLIHLGGENGWFTFNWAWKLRGWIDQLFGGVGMRDRRKNKETLVVGDTIDCWRIVQADLNEGALLLKAEMKLPGEAWFEFHIGPKIIEEKITFFPKGVGGRLYWYLFLPIHKIIFRKMAERIGGQ